MTLYILLPAYNEGESLVPLLKRIKTMVENISAAKRKLSFSFANEQARFKYK